MPTTRKRKIRNIAKRPLLDFIRIFLMDGPEVYRKAMTPPREPGLTGMALSFMMRGHGKTLDLKDYTYEDAWREHKKEILRIWKAEKRKGHPWAARQFD